MGQNLQISWFCSKISQNLDFGYFFNIDFGKNCRKMSNLVKFVNNLDFGQICQKFLILAKMLKNLDLVKNYKTIEFGQNFQNMTILVKIVGNSRFWSKLTKMSIM